MSVVDQSIVGNGRFEVSCSIQSSLALREVIADGVAQVHENDRSVSSLGCKSQFTQY